MNLFSKHVFRGFSVLGAALGTKDSDMDRVDKQGSLPSRTWVTILGRDRTLEEHQVDRDVLSNLSLSPI